MSETHNERGPLGWSVVAGAEHAAGEPAICHHSGPDAAAPAIPQAGHAVSQIGMSTGKNAVMGGHTRGAGCPDGLFGAGNRVGPPTDREAARGALKKKGASGRGPKP